MKFAEYVLSHFFLAPYEQKTKRYRSKSTGRFRSTSQKQTRWRDKKGRFIKAPEFFRATIAVNNVPISNRLHHFSVSQIETEIDMEMLQEELLKYMEKEIDYNREEWWFEPVFGIEYPTPIKAKRPDIYFQHRVGRKS